MLVYVFLLISRNDSANKVDYLVAEVRNKADYKKVTSPNLKKSNSQGAKPVPATENPGYTVKNRTVNTSVVPAEMNDTHINGILMEPVNAEYTRNIYFTIKTTNKYYTERLFPLMLTWLQVVDKNKVSHITLYSS